jgi:hypothetical protein
MRTCLPVLFGLLLLPTCLPAQETADYLRDVKPLLKTRCYACHGALKQRAHLRLDSGASIRKGGRHGPAVKPGDPAGSLLIKRITAPDEDGRMPPEGKALTVEQITKLKAWIAAGARSPADERPEADPRAHWAFHKPSRPVLGTPSPRIAICGLEGSRLYESNNPIDAFLAAEWAKHGLTPRPPADRATLLRRVYLDLIGLPPTRAELHAFLADDSPDAYEKVVDRLLASPYYAERWARHWMDVWRYSDWYGRRSVPDVLNSYGMIWRWRDWIIRSIAEDKGYDWMIQQMLAADEINPTDEANLVATGFIVRNFFRWNYDQWKKDLVEHTGKAFLGLTLNCCHCHDHKYDPISQEEHFRFRAFFEPIEIRHDRVPGEPDPGPYPKYDYGKSYPPITSGMVRVYDAKLDAQTWMFTRGDARNKVPGKPPVTPGVPAILGGKVDITPVELPVTVWYPGLKPWVVAEETTKREAAVHDAQAAVGSAKAQLAGAEKQLHEAATQTSLSCHSLATLLATLAPDMARARHALALAEAQLRVADADLASFQARLAADRACYLERVPEADWRRLAKVASKAERRFQLERAGLAQLKAEQALAQAAAGLKKAALDALHQQLVAAQQQVAQARQRYADDASTAYTPLGPVYPARSTGRRTALARWISSRDNPLTARVAVNYIWAWHFGRPLVDSTYDFGCNGKPPSHPELLDWLAVEFMENGWHMKPLHRLIVTSQAYRMQSDPGPADSPNRKADPDNRFLWHFRAGRMEAEEVRDSILYLAGQLDPTPGGPDIPHEQGLTCRRRSIYFTHHGESKMLFLELFDEVNACDGYQRSVSVVPQQALALSNSELTLRQSRLLARRLTKELGPGGEEAFVRAAFEQVLGRPPSAAEQAASLAFLSRQAQLFREGRLKGPSSTDGPATEPALRARENLIHVLFNHSEFVTVR